MTTITIPLDNYTGDTPLHVEDLDVGEGYGVRLRINLHPNEFLGGDRPEPGEDDLVTELIRRRSGAHYLDVPDGDEDALKGAHIAQAEAEAILAMIERYTRSLDHVRAEHSLDRDLLPGEARALAAGLVHFAKEVETR